MLKNGIHLPVAARLAHVLPILALILTSSPTPALGPTGAQTPTPTTSSTTTVASADYYVDASTGSDSHYDGTSATVNGRHGPWATIAHAANISPSNKTIKIAAGTYRLEQIEPKSGQTFVGPCGTPPCARSAQAILNGSKVLVVGRDN